MEFLSIKITDNYGASASGSFVLKVNNVNDIPLLTGNIPNQQTNVNQQYSYNVNSNLFTDPDVNDELSVTAKLSDGTALPEWLSFNSTNMLFGGIPETTGIWNIQLIATDKSGASASTSFYLTVNNVTSIIDLEQSKITVSPNPTPGIVFIEFEKVWENVNYELRDNSGKLIKSDKIDNRVTQLNLSDLTDGSYFIILSNGNQKVVKQIILQKN